MGNLQSSWLNIAMHLYCMCQIPVFNAIHTIVTDMECNIKIDRLPVGRGTDQWKWYCPPERWFCNKLSANKCEESIYKFIYWSMCFANIIKHTYTPNIECGCIHYWRNQFKICNINGLIHILRPLVVYILVQRCIKGQSLYAINVN